MTAKTNGYTVSQPYEFEQSAQAQFQFGNTLSAVKYQLLAIESRKQIFDNSKEDIDSRVALAQC